MENVYCLDFDGTLTTHDTLLEFIRYARGTKALLWGLVLYSPLLVLMKLRLYSNGKTKQRFFAHFFKSMPISNFDTLCQQFAKAKEGLLRPVAVDVCKHAAENGQRLIVVSASVENWVKPFVPQAEVLATKVETADGRLTGRFLTPNCYGSEKVRRIREVLTGARDQYHIIAYGDSRGDSEMLNYADEAYLRFRRIK